MKRLILLLLSATTLLSLLLCLSGAFFWFRSHRIHDRGGITIGDARYTLHSNAGRLTLFRPPDRGPDDALAVQMAAQIRNDDIKWQPFAQRQKPPALNINGWFYGINGNLRPDSTGAGQMFAKFNWRTGMRSAGRPLLRALEDPQRVVAAHKLLIYLKQASYRCPFEVAGDQVTIFFDGLPVRFRASDLGGVRADSSAWPSLRDLWHDRLDVPVISLHYAWLVVASALLPLMQCARYWQRRHAMKRGCCPVCGYDLRATPQRCPECGTTPAPARCDVAE